MKPNAESVVDTATNALREAIRYGRFAPGQRLVVADLKEIYGTSAGPIREAITRLAGEGLIDLIPNRGAVVRTFAERDMRELFQVREALEGMVARLAALNAHRADYADQLRALMAKLEAHTRDGDISLSVTREEFHDLLYEMSGNAKLKETAVRLSYPGYGVRYSRLIGAARTQASLAEHQAVADAILAGDPPAAERLMRQHLRNTAIAIQDAIDAAPDFKSAFFGSDERQGSPAN